MTALVAASGLVALALVVAFGALAAARHRPDGHQASPLKPSRLRTIHVTADSVTLTWKPLPGTRYRVELGGVGKATTSHGKFTFHGLACATSYTAAVQAVGRGGKRSGVAQRTVRTASCAQPGGPSTNKLPWRPPSCGDASHHCVDLYLGDTGSNQSPQLSSDTDYRIHLPNAPLHGGLQIRGGHNVIIIGGQIDLTVPCDDSSSDCHGINIDRGTAGGEIYIEGVWIRDPQSPIKQSTGDGIDMAAENTTLTLQNVRIDGISGCGGKNDHADVFQPYSAGGSQIRIAGLTATSNCQGMTIDPDLTKTNLAGYAISNVNLTALPNPYLGLGNRYMWWLTDGCHSGPISLTNVYTQEPGGLGINSIWPDTNQPLGCVSVLGPNGTVSFPHEPQINGQIQRGNPPGGDFVPLGVAGAHYLSPGYR